MWRNSIAVLGMVVAGAATAQQTADETLKQLQVFDCVLDGAQTIYVFQTAADDAISLVGDADAPVRLGEKGISLMTADGAREIGDGVYNVYKDGTAQSGTCSDSTALAHVIYPALTTVYAPSAKGKTVEEQAAAAALKDLEVRASNAQAAANKATSELEVATASLAATTIERDDLRLLAEQQSNTIAATKAELDDTTKVYGEAIEWLDAERGHTKALTAEVAMLTADFEVANEALEVAKAKGSEAAVKLTSVETDLAELRTLHQAVMSAADEFKIQLDDSNTKLEGAEQSRRALVATVAGLNQKITDLEGKLKAERGKVESANNDIEAATKKAEAATARVRSISGLTDAAIARVATLQGRSQNAIRSELCRFIGRSANCGR